MQGKIDILAVSQGFFSQAVGSDMRLKEEIEKKGICLNIFRDPSTFWLGFNMKDKVLGGNKPLRQAISFAIDRQRYVRLFYEGRSEAAYGVIPPLLRFEGRPDLPGAEQASPQIEEKIGDTFDVERAVELLKEAEIIYGGKLPALTLTMPGTGSGFRKEADFFRHALEEIGLEIVVEYLDWPRFQEKLRSRDVQMFCSGWIGQYPDAENFLQLFYSKNIQGGLNSFNYCSVEFDKIYERVSVMADGPERERLYGQAEMMIMQDYPAVFLRHGLGVILYHKWLKNAKSNSYGYGLGKYRRVDGQMRKIYQDLQGEK